MTTPLAKRFSHRDTTTETEAMTTLDIFRQQLALLAKDDQHTEKMRSNLASVLLLTDAEWSRSADRMIWAVLEECTKRRHAHIIDLFVKHDRRIFERGVSSVTYLYLAVNDNNVLLVERFIAGGVANCKSSFRCLQHRRQ